MLSILSRNLSKNLSFVKKMSDSISASAERAKRVQENVLQQNYRLETENKLRQKINFDNPLQDLEHQLTGEIARSLKRSEDKLKYFIEKTEEVYKQLSKDGEKSKDPKQIQKYNEMVKSCEKARWEFLIHRQSCGITIKNHEIVSNMYRIPPRIV